MIRVSLSITPVLKKHSQRVQEQRQRRGQVGEREKEEGGFGKARRNIIRYYDLTFMCSPHVAVSCLFARQHDVTATLELATTQISKDDSHGKDETEGKKIGRRHINDR